MVRIPCPALRSLCRPCGDAGQCNSERTRRRIPFPSLSRCSSLLTLACCFATVEEVRPASRQNSRQTHPASDKGESPPSLARILLRLTQLVAVIVDCWRHPPARGQHLQEQRRRDPRSWSWSENQRGRGSAAHGGCWRQGASARVRRNAAEAGR